MPRNRADTAIMKLGKIQFIINNLFIYFFACFRTIFLRNYVSPYLIKLREAPILPESQIQFGRRPMIGRRMCSLIGQASIDLELTSYPKVMIRSSQGHSRVKSAQNG